jgi:glycosyltransferase involved in cell wall biosynthesis
MRLACVQNGDYTQAARQFAQGGSETYNGQFYTVSAFQRFTAGQPHIVVSMDAPPHEERQGAAVWCGIPQPKFFVRLPRRWISLLHARQIIQRLERFEPSHLLLRCLDLVGCELLSWANRHGIKAAAIFAARLDPHHPPSLRFCRLGNDNNVAFFANHNRVAAQTMIECGLRSEKAIAWDLPPAVTPDEHVPRRRDAADVVRLLYAGALEPAKGIEDLIEAAELRHAAGQRIDLTVCGAGSLLDKLRAHEGIRQGWLAVLGKVAHEQVVDRMAGADFVVVPSRSEFNEGLPFVIQEGLAVRTPLLLSKHPVFLKYLDEGQGVAFFEERNPQALSALIEKLSCDPMRYAQLSQRTADAWQTLQCPLKFHDVLNRLAEKWELPQSPAPKPAMVA